MIESTLSKQTENLHEKQLSIMCDLEIIISNMDEYQKKFPYSEECRPMLRDAFDNTSNYDEMAERFRNMDSYHVTPFPSELMIIDAHWIPFFTFTEDDSSNIDLEIQSRLLECKRDGEEFTLLSYLNDHCKEIKERHEELNILVEKFTRIFHNPDDTRTSAQLFCFDIRGWDGRLDGDRPIVLIDEIIGWLRCFKFVVNSLKTSAQHSMYLVQHPQQFPYLWKMPPQPTEPGNGVNPLPLPAQTIHWNTDASALYDIFGQLLKMTMPNGVTPINRKEGDHTIKDLAAMIHHHFSFAKGNPTLDQVERQLQLMTDPANAGAKRNKITIEINCKPDTE